MRTAAQYRQEYRADLRRWLRRSVCWPFVDDGPIARQAIKEIHARQLDWQQSSPSDEEVRIALVDARYRDWQRSRFRVLAGGRT